MTDERLALLAELAYAPHHSGFRAAEAQEMVNELRAERERSAALAWKLAEQRETTDHLTGHLHAQEEAAATLVAFLATVYQDSTVLLEKTDYPGYGHVYITHHAVGELGFTVRERHFGMFPPRVTRVTDWPRETHTPEEDEERLKALAAYEWCWHGGMNEPLVATPEQLALRPY